MKKLTLLLLALFTTAPVLSMNLSEEELTKLADEIVLELFIEEEQYQNYLKLLQVIKNKDASTVKQLLSKYKFNLNKRLYETKLLPLEIAILKNQMDSHSEIIYLLLKHGANPNEVNLQAAPLFKDIINEAQTFYGASTEQVRFVKELTEAQANIFASYEVQFKEDSAVPEACDTFTLTLTPLNHSRKQSLKEIRDYWENIESDFNSFKKNPASFIAQTSTLDGKPLPNEIFLALMYRNPEFHDELANVYSRFALQSQLDQAIALLEKVNFTKNEIQEFKKLNLPTNAQQLNNRFGHAEKSFAKTRDLKFNFR